MVWKRVCAWVVMLKLRVWRPRATWFKFTVCHIGTKNRSEMVKNKSLFLFYSEKSLRPEFELSDTIFPQFFDKFLIFCSLFTSVASKQDFFLMVKVHKDLDILHHQTSPNGEHNRWAIHTHSREWTWLIPEGHVVVSLRAAPRGSLPVWLTVAIATDNDLLLRSLWTLMQSAISALQCHHCISANMSPSLHQHREIT